MTFNAEQVEELHRELEEVIKALNALLLQTVQVGQKQENEHTKEFLLSGLGRRLKILRYSLLTIFRLFPPEATRPIASDDLEGVQVAHHAFVMNLYGTFENWAWAFVSRHGLLGAIGDRKKIGLFLRSTQQFLPVPLKAYLASETMIRWHTDYLKNYRDALAHRIPLYIPPAAYTHEEGARYMKLDREECEHIVAQRWDDLERARQEKDALGSAYPVFLHSLSDEEGLRPILLHPQIISDAKTILEFGPMFFQHWHECTAPGNDVARMA